MKIPAFLMLLHLAAVDTGWSGTNKTATTPQPLTIWRSYADAILL